MPPIFFIFTRYFPQTWEANFLIFIFTFAAET